MLDDVYPKSMRLLFTNRERELKQLLFFKNELLSGKQKNICILGPRRYGKSMLMKEFIFRTTKDRSVMMPYINLEPLVTTPYDFVVKFVGTINYQLFGNEKGYLDYLTKEALLGKNIPSELQTYLQRMYSELEKALPNPSYLLTLAFSYPSQIVKTQRKRMMLFLDEFQEIMTLSKQKNVGNPLSLFREYFSIDALSYVLAGSIVRVLESIFSDEHSPLFAQAEKLYLAPFTREGTADLIKKILPIHNPLVNAALFQYSAGHPFYIVHIAKRVHMIHDMQDVEITPELVKQAFIIETLSVEGKIYDLCDYLYSISLSRARYYAPLKSILKILAAEEGLNQSQVARKLRLSQGATKEYLNELVKIGFIRESEKHYFYHDPVLKYWIAYVQEGIELYGFPSKKDIIILLKELDEKFQKAASELGKAKEYEFKVKLEAEYKMTLEHYTSSDGQVEFDLVGEKNSIVYIFEIKWRNKPVNIKEMMIFYEKVKKSGFTQRKKKLFVLSKSGFDEKALVFAEKQKITCLDAEMNEIMIG